MKFDLRARVVAEFLGTAFLAAAVIGSGIMGSGWRAETLPLHYSQIRLRLVPPLWR